MGLLWIGTIKNRVTPSSSLPMTGATDKAISQRYEISNDAWRGYVTPQGKGSLVVITSVDQPHAIANLETFGKEQEAAIFHTVQL